MARGKIGDVILQAGHRPRWTTQDACGNCHGDLTDAEMVEVGIGFSDGRYYFDLAKIYA